MVSRRKKIASALLVMLAGLALAWPFRRRLGDDQPSPTTPALASAPLTPSQTKTPLISMQRLSGPVDLSSPPKLAPPTAGQRELTPAISAALTPSDPFQQMSNLSADLATTPTPLTPPITRNPPPPDPPALADQYRPDLDSIDPAAARPVYSTARRGAPAEDLEDSFTDDNASRIHVVHNGDTLERLAKRYLGDERRALEIFDLNRETLTNPHLLPIGAEILIPRDGKSIVQE